MLVSKQLNRKYRPTNTMVQLPPTLTLSSQIHSPQNFQCSTKKNVFLQYAHVMHMHKASHDDTDIVCMLFLASQNF